MKIQYDGWIRFVYPPLDDIVVKFHNVLVDMIGLDFDFDYSQNASECRDNLRIIFE
jgi:hypothetical protein